MKSLSNQLIAEKIHPDIEYTELGDLPEKVLQFGSGNFLRAFIDWQIHQLNKKSLFNGKIVIYKPTPQGEFAELITKQDNLYTVILKGLQDGEIIDKSEIISSVSRTFSYEQWNHVLSLAPSRDLEFIFSNTTEAGIVYNKEPFPEENEIPKSFPAKLTYFLYERFRHGREKAPSITIIPCELIEENGDKLKEFVLKKADDWNFPTEFVTWIHENVRFCNTLVDRIVPGFPHDSIEEYREKLGYKDAGLTVGEPYHLFAIDADAFVQERFPLHLAELNVIWGDTNLQREIKVRLLNGPHTMMFSVGHLLGLKTVYQVMENNLTKQFIEETFKEIKKTVTYDEKKKEVFINHVIERFSNPYHNHFLLDIGLNAVSKFKSRLLPSIEEYVEKENKLPKSIVFSMAALILFYKPLKKEKNHLVGEVNGAEYKMKDDEDVLQLMNNAWETYKDSKKVGLLVEQICGASYLWGQDLNNIKELSGAVEKYLKGMLDEGMNTALEKFLN